MTIGIRLVEDEYGACPECGAYWGHPDKKLNWTNRQKVEDFWRCYNPACRVAYYHPETKKVELEYKHREHLNCQCVELKDCTWKWIETKIFGKFYVPICPKCAEHEYNDAGYSFCHTPIIHKGFKTGGCQCRTKAKEHVIK